MLYIPFPKLQEGLCSIHEWERLPFYYGLKLVCHTKNVSVSYKIHEQTFIETVKL